MDSLEKKCYYVQNHAKNTSLFSKRQLVKMALGCRKQRQFSVTMNQTNLIYSHPWRSELLHLDSWKGVELLFPIVYNPHSLKQYVWHHAHNRKKKSMLNYQQEILVLLLFLKLQGTEVPQQCCINLQWQLRCTV